MEKQARVEKQVPVRVTLDDEADASYIYLADEPALGWRHRETVPLPSGPNDRMVNVDFDDDGRIVGSSSSTPVRCCQTSS